MLREERYTLAGKLSYAFEKLEDTREWMELTFFDEGRSHYRLSQRMGPDPQRFFVDVVIGGRDVARYVSDWDRFLSGYPAEEVLAPMDSRREWGTPYPPLEEHRARTDQARIDGIRERGGNLTRPRQIEFGFWFGKGFRQAEAELARLGCRWRSKEDRKGRIGPFPGGCAKKVRLDPATLARWHERFTELAQRLGGRYYRWTEP